MLIYDSQKQLVGASEEYLHIFGFETLQQFQQKFSDFSELFVKKPGYVHDFQHVNWIDFVDCADSLEDAKVIIETEKKERTWETF